MFWPQSPEVLTAVPLRITPQPSSTSCPRGCLGENGSRPCRHRRFCARPFHMNRNQSSEPLSTAKPREVLSHLFRLGGHRSDRRTVLPLDSGDQFVSLVDTLQSFGSPPSLICSPNRSSPAATLNPTNISLLFIFFVPFKVSAQ
jgi:hypothetical protein